MTLTPESIANPNLPRTKMNGYSIQATDDFLKEVAWEWRRLHRDLRELSEQNAELERRLDEIQRKIEDLRGEPVVRGEREPSSAAALAAALRAAEAIRQDARQESEAMLKKARRRATTLDDELERARATTAERIRELEETQQQARSRLSAFLTEMLAAVEHPAEEETVDVVRELPMRVVVSSDEPAASER
jgi:cell division septum initiation protein DivIVA